MYSNNRPHLSPFWDMKSDDVLLREMSGGGFENVFLYVLKVLCALFNFA